MHNTHHQRMFGGALIMNSATGTHVTYVCDEITYVGSASQQTSKNDARPCRQQSNRINPTSEIHIGKQSTMLIGGAFPMETIICAHVFDPISVRYFIIVCGHKRDLNTNAIARVCDIRGSANVLRGDASIHP